MTSPTRVALLLDGSGTPMPGGCCWRHGLRAAARSAGAEVVDLTRPGTGAAGAGSHLTGQARAASLPVVLRRPLGMARRTARTVVDLPGRISRARRVRAELAPLLRAATLVVAESADGVRFAAGCGVDRSRLWLLALPDGPRYADDGTDYTADLTAVSPHVAGLLTDNETARCWLERATSGQRTRVRLFPSIAVDRPCSVCAHLPETAWRPAAPAPRQSWDGARLITPPPVTAQQSEQTAAAQDGALRALLATVPSPRPERSGRPRSVLLAGYDLKFARDLAEHLDRRPDLSVTVDDWPDLGTPTAGTLARLRDADAVFAEWARTSAAWLSHRKRPGQFLAVRLHRFELDSRYPREIAMSNVDAVVYIAPLFGRRIRDELGWPAEKLVYLPNFLDLEWYDRPKLPDARFAIGFVGMEWSRKRFDLALDLLAAVRRADHRFRLVVRSVMPWRNEFVWSRPAEREYAGHCFARIERDPLLRDSVIFEPPGRDMARWYRRVGFLASTSDEEGSHASVAEAMAAGSVPVIRSWPGASEIYSTEWVHASIDGAVRTVLGGAEEPAWAELAGRARAEVARTHDPAAVVDAWADLLHGDLAAARRRFPDQQLAPASQREGRYV